MLTTIATHSLGKQYGRVHALNDLTLNFEAGRFYALLGPNGAGKSTLIRLLMAFEQPTSGHCEILGKSLESDPYGITQVVGFISEDLQYDFPISIGEFTQVNRKVFPNWSQQILEDLLQIMRLNPRAKFSELSRGQRMRLFFAIAAAKQPKVMLLDEITSVLDAFARDYILEALSLMAQRGATIVMATNVVSEINTAAEDLVLLDRGKLFQQTRLEDFAAAHIKLRVEKDQRAEIPKGAVLVGTNVDKSLSYIINREDLVEGFDTAAEDRRAITLSELYTFFIKKLED